MAALRVQLRMALSERDGMANELSAMHKQIMREAEANLVAQNCLLSENQQIAKLSALLTKSRNGITRLLELRKQDEIKIKSLALTASATPLTATSLTPLTASPSAAAATSAVVTPSGGGGDPITISPNLTSADPNSHSLNLSSPTEIEGSFNSTQPEAAAAMLLSPTLAPTTPAAAPIATDLSF